MSFSKIQFPSIVFRRTSGKRRRAWRQAASARISIAAAELAAVANDAAGFDVEGNFSDRPAGEPRAFQLSQRRTADEQRAHACRV
ncbi:MAG: hypothetical protein WAN23_18875 [Candidatus Acidiferrales bacterium]